jgi:hypothetical protein
MFHLFIIEGPFRCRASFDTPVRQAHRMKGTKDLSGGQIQPFIQDERDFDST